MSPVHWRRYLRHGTLTQLAALEAVARHASFTRAAEELHMAQPTVSLHVKKLSELIGLPLLETTDRRPQCTAAGHEVCAATRDIFRALAHLHTRLAMLRSPAAGELHVAISTTAKYFVPHLLSSFWRSHPRVRISLSVMNREQLLGRMTEGLDDLYVLSNPPEGAALSLHTLLANPMELYAGADHPLAGHRRLQFSDVAGEPFLMREQGSGTRLVAEQWFAEQHARPVVRMELGSNEAIKQAVIAGLGVALLSGHTVGAANRRAGLVALHVTGLPIMRYWYLAYPENRPLTPVAQAFVAHSTRSETLAQLAVQTAGGKRKLSNCPA